MRAISHLQQKYAKKLDHLDLDLLLAHAIGKTREFVAAHPEYVLTARQAEKFESLTKRRLKHEPMAYILGQKEFYGLDFAVTSATLIPRPETEMLVDEALDSLHSILRSKLCNEATAIDVGTGSGNIIISIAKNLEPAWTSDVQMRKGHRMSFFGLDISSEALRVARRNAKKHNVNDKVKFTKSDLLSELIKTKKLKANKLVIVANLPYLSREIYSTTAADVKKFEPKSALYSPKQGLQHYEKLLKQIKELKANGQWLTAIIEISPEQKLPLARLIKKYFPDAKTEFQKDLAGRTRIAIISFWAP